MKNLIVVAFLLTLSTSSCNKEDKQTPWVCSPCGTYTGTYDVTIQIPLTNTDTTFIDIPTTIEILSNNNDSVNINFDFSGFSGNPLGMSFLNFKQAYWIDSSIIGMETYTMPFIAEFNFIANCSTNYNRIQGNISISGDAEGDIAFDVIRQ